jgi:hypothetical protein
MQSLVQYLLNRSTEECCEAGQAFSKLFTFGVHHRHPVTKDLAITKAAQEINDILGVVDMLRDFGVDIFGIGKPEAIEAKKLKIFRNMQESIDAGAVVLTTEELAQLNASYPNERPLVQPQGHAGDQLAKLRQMCPELFREDGTLDQFRASIATRLFVNHTQRPPAAAGTVPHEDGTIGTVKTDGGIVTTL